MIVFFQNKEKKNLNGVDETSEDKTHDTKSLILILICPCLDSKESSTATHQASHTTTDGTLLTRTESLNSTEQPHSHDLPTTTQYPLQTTTHSHPWTHSYHLTPYPPHDDSPFVL